MKAFVLFLALAANSQAETPYVSAPLELRHGRHHIIIPQRDEHGPHDWYADACRGGIERSVVHAVTRRGETLYIVFTCAGWSRGEAQSRGRCGAGWEHQINWMAIRGGVVIAHQQNDIESCWRDTCGGIHGWKGGTLVWGSAGTDTGYSAMYDPGAPEKGLQLKETYKLPRS